MSSPGIEFGANVAVPSPQFTVVANGASPASASRIVYLTHTCSRS